MIFCMNNTQIDAPMPYTRDQSDSNLL